MNSSAMMHFYLALVYQRTSRNDEALAEFKEALHWDPKNFLPISYWGGCTSINKRPKRLFLC